MEIINRYWKHALAIIIVLLLAGGGLWQYERTRVPQFPIETADHLTNWTFVGAYNGNADLIAKTQADIAHLASLMGKGEYDDYDLNLGQALDYEHLGDGKNAYAYYNRAIKIHPTKGLAYVDLGNLMNELKAYQTAADAYAKAVAVEPTQLEYHLQRLTYLTQQFPRDNALVVGAFTDASKAFGDNAEILAIEAAWLTELGQYADAIKAWQTARMLSPASHYAAIDAAIASLKAKLATH